MSEQNESITLSIPVDRGEFEEWQAATKARGNGSGSVQLRVSDPGRLHGGYHRGLDEYILWLAGLEPAVPPWGSPFSRAKYFDAIWRNDSRISGVLFTMISRLSSLGWAISGPVADLRKWYDIFAWAEEDWTMFIKLIATDYLTTDEGAIFETVRDSYPKGNLQELWAMDAKRCLPGPIEINTLMESTGVAQPVVFPLVFRDQDTYKGLEKGEFHRIVSLPATDMYRRRMGFCFMSRVLRYALLANDLLMYQEEKVKNLPPEGIVTVTGITRTQLDNAVAQWKQSREQKQSQVWPGLLWLVSNAFGQEMQVNFHSFRDVWQGYSEREANEIFMKVVALDAGVDVMEFWQAEFHGATKASSWLQHKKSMGKGSAEFIVDFERWASRVLPMDYAFRFDTPDDEQDLMVERIKKAKIDNILALVKPVGSAGTAEAEESEGDGPFADAAKQFGGASAGNSAGEGLITLEQAREMLAEQQVIPQRYVMPAEQVATDVLRSLTGRDVGTMMFPDGHIQRDRPYWNLNSASIGESQLPRAGIDQMLKAIDPGVAQHLERIGKQWDVMTWALEPLLQAWKSDILQWMEDDPAALVSDEYWQGWGERISEVLMPHYVNTATQGSLSTAFPISFERRNAIAQEVAGRRMFDLVSLTGSTSTVRSHRALTDQIRKDLADGKIGWSDVEGRLVPAFGHARARNIAVSENTDIWAESQLTTAIEAKAKEKRSVRADAGRPCPSGVCPAAEQAGWIPIDQAFPGTGGKQRAKFHPHCYCYGQYR